MVLLAVNSRLKSSWKSTSSTSTFLADMARELPLRTDALETDALSFLGRFDTAYDLLVSVLELAPSLASFFLKVGSYPSMESTSLTILFAVIRSFSYRVDLALCFDLKLRAEPGLFLLDEERARSDSLMSVSLSVSFFLFRPRSSPSSLGSYRMVAPRRGS